MLTYIYMHLNNKYTTEKKQIVQHVQIQRNWINK